MLKLKVYQKLHLVLVTYLIPVFWNKPNSSDSALLELNVSTSR